MPRCGWPRRWLPPGRSPTPRAGAPAPDLGPRLQALDTPLQALLAGLRSALPTAAPPAMPPLAPVGEAPSLARLNLLLRDDDPEAACYLHDHEPALRTSLRERFHAVRAAVDAFDFDAALALTAPPANAARYFIDGPDSWDDGFVGWTVPAWVCCMFR